MHTHIARGKKPSRVITVTRTIVVEYAGSEGGRGNAIATSRNSLQRPWIKCRLSDGRLPLRRREREWRGEWVRIRWAPRASILEKRETRQLK